MSLKDRILRHLTDGQAISLRTLAYREGVNYSTAGDLLRAGVLVKIGELPHTCARQRYGTPIVVAAEFAEAHGVKPRVTWAHRRRQAEAASCAG